MMNKRGDISITILVIGVVAICILTIISFQMSMNNVEESSVIIGLINQVDSLAEDIKFSKNINRDAKDVLDIFDKQDDLKSLIFFRAEENKNNYLIEGIYGSLNFGWSFSTTAKSRDKICSVKYTFNT